MKNKLIKTLCRHSMIMGAIWVLSACSTYKPNLTYFADIKESRQGEMTLEIPPLRIVPDDALLITVNSKIPDATAIYNIPLVNPAQRANTSMTASPRQQTYIVDSKGYINFPEIGKIHVEGMTTEELADYITNEISKEVVDPYVRVELTSFHIQIIGEVNHPGSVYSTAQRLSVLDAISAAGDLTPYGQRENVLIVRQEKDGNKYYRVNLNDSKLLSSPQFYLKQNDVIIVEPNEIRKSNTRYNQDNAYRLSVISTVVSAASVVASMAIALLMR